MPTYKYRAKKGPQDILEGTLEAQSQKEAVERLSQTGYLPLSVELDARASFGRKQGARGALGRIKSREITLFSRQLASLLKAGVPILRALDIIAEQSENHSLKSMLLGIRNAVKDGGTFSSALGAYPKLFSSLYLAMVRTGENSGALPQALLRIAEYRVKQEALLSRIKMSMAYPALMALVGVATIIFMFVFVMPRLMGIYGTLGQDLPLPTRILIAISSTLRHTFLWLIMGVAGMLALIGRNLKTQAGKMFFSLLQLRLPIVGSFIVKAELSRFCATLELLIKSGTPILKALDVSIPVIENEIIKNLLRKSSKELEQGGAFGKSLKNAKLFPLFMSNLISVGEESGRLDEALSEVALSYEHDTDEGLSMMSNLLEPLMILAMGLIVGFIVVAMLLPIFEINAMVQ